MLGHEVSRKHLLSRVHELTCYSLAMMEIYLGIAHIFRRFELALYETDRSDVLMFHEFFLPAPVLTSKGVRAKITKVYE